MSVVVIVGGASGIGLAAARTLQHDGWDLHLMDADEQALETAAVELTPDRSAPPRHKPCGDRPQTRWPTVRTDLVDITDEDTVAAAFACYRDTDQLRGLVNSAGILQLGRITDLSEADWDRVVDVNLRGAFLSCRAAIQCMPSGGSIVNLTSQSGRTKSYYSSPAYVASKAGLIGLTMSLAAQHAADGIRANAVAPSLVETPMIAQAYTEHQRKAMLASIPLGRFAHPQELANVIAFLISDRSSYITGQTVNVNGGSFMQ